MLTPFLLAFLSFVLYTLALPPYGVWILAFFVPIFWVPLIQMDFPTTRRRFYWALYLASLLFWSFGLLWLPLPHWGIWFGWAAISFYLAIYFPLFIGASRILVHRFRLPLVLAAPLAWVGAEWFRFHVLDGFSFRSLEHALYLKPALIQSAVLFDEYAAGALLVFIGTLAGIVLSPVGTKRLPRFVPTRARRTDENVAAYELAQMKEKSPTRVEFRLLAAVAAGLILYFNLYFGAAAIKEILTQKPAQEARPIRVALLQDGETFRFPIPDATNLAIHGRYMAETEAAAKHRPLDLIVWPEGTFARPFWFVEPGGRFPGMETLDESVAVEQTAAVLAEQTKPFDEWVRRIDTPVLVGSTSFVAEKSGKTTAYNSAVYRTPAGPSERYDKIQRVLFGEYIPLVEWLPDGFPLKTLTEPIGAGKLPGIFSVGERTALVSICFESSMPHQIAQRIRAAAYEGNNPDFLLNISNDGWFRGGVENELHRATYVFRAIENRRWLLAAVHGDASLAVDPAGRIVSLGEKGKTGSILLGFSPSAPVESAARRAARSIPACCAAVFLAAFGYALVRRRLEKRRATRSTGNANADSVQ